MSKNIAIIGIGKFGSSILDALIDQKTKNIFIVDNDEVLLRNCISNYNGIVTGVSFDARQKVFLEENGIGEMDIAIVAISEITSSVIIAMNLMDLKIKKVIVKATDINHKRILKNIGIKEIIQSEKIAADTIAKSIDLTKSVPFQVIDDTYLSLKLKITNPDIDGETILTMKMDNNIKFRISYIERNNRILFVDDSTEIKMDDYIYMIIKSNLLESTISKFTKN